MTKKTSVLFVCVENAGRSQMAEAFAKKRGLDATSAGTLPGEVVNPMVAEAMAEKGYDVGTNKPKMLTLEMIERADLVITMGCSVEKVCPRPMLMKMNKKLVDWGLDDPKGKSLAQVRKIRDEIEERVDGLVG
ncbi:MAG TPA: arsenate reductase ArsC [Nitrososphaerales archaeon]|nr:arsenate reductase ArsC [Nitrososphaerales archaeon]